MNWKREVLEKQINWRKEMRGADHCSSIGECKDAGTSGVAVGLDREAKKKGGECEKEFGTAWLVQTFLLLAPSNEKKYW
jgi:hypothetical protein